MTGYHHVTRVCVFVVLLFTGGACLTLGALWYRHPVCLCGACACSTDSGEGERGKGKRALLPRCRSFAIWLLYCCSPSPAVNDDDVQNTHFCRESSFFFFHHSSFRALCLFSSLLFSSVVDAHRAVFLSQLFSTHHCFDRSPCSLPLSSSHTLLAALALAWQGFTAQVRAHLKTHA